MDRFGERASLLRSVEKMISYARENEKKKASSQTGLFDFQDDAHLASLNFSLERAEPMSFEDQIKGEKTSIGYSVSGHGLDGLKPFIDRRTIGKEHVVKFLSDLETFEETRTLVDAEARSDTPGGDSETPEAGRIPLGNNVPPSVGGTSEISEMEEKKVDPPRKEREKQVKVRFI